MSKPIGKWREKPASEEDAADGPDGSPPKIRDEPCKIKILGDWGGKKGRLLLLKKEERGAMGVEQVRIAREREPHSQRREYMANSLGGGVGPK